MPKSIGEKKRQKILIIILVIVLIIIGIVWYSSYSKKKSGSEIGLPQEQIPITMGIKEIKLDLTVLDNDLFKSLKSHGALPVVAGETGNSNPFESQ